MNVRVGGFYRVPTKQELAPLREKLVRARVCARSGRLGRKAAVPRLRARRRAGRDERAGEYPIDRGRLVSNRGLDIAPDEFEQHVIEEHVEHSNALYARMKDAAPTSPGRWRATT